MHFHSILSRKETQKIKLENWKGVKIIFVSRNALVIFHEKIFNLLSDMWRRVTSKVIINHARINNISFFLWWQTDVSRDRVSLNLTSNTSWKEIRFRHSITCMWRQSFSIRFNLFSISINLVPFKHDIHSTSLQNRAKLIKTFT